MPGICQPRLAAGEACTAGSFSQCDDGLECIAAADFASGSCRAPGAAGEPCMRYISDLDLQSGVVQPTGACQDGFICDFTVAVPVCVTPKPAGAACTTAVDCGVGLECSAPGVGIMRAGGVISPLPEPGACVAPTSLGGACGACLVFDACVNGVCTAQPQIGDVCTIGRGPTGCVVGYCDPVTLRCTPRVPEGGACTPGVDDCVLPLDCDNSSHRCTSTPTCVSG
jgi:hypothetical protein